MLAMITLALPARAEPVRTLEASDTSVVVGNDQFSLRIWATGKFGEVQAGGREYFWLGALYTGPIVPETGESLRAVQGETTRGGIGPAPAMARPEVRGDCLLVTVSRDCSRAEIYDGATLYHLTQTFEVHPSGYIRLRYEFDYRRLFDMSSASLYLALTGEQVGGRRYWADYTSHVTPGVFDGSGSSRIDEIRGAVRTLEVACEAGPLHLWFDEVPTVAAQVWSAGKHFPITLPAPGAERRSLVYPGTRGVLSFGIKLPIGDAT
jgi:hypothetical protein